MLATLTSKGVGGGEGVHFGELMDICSQAWIRREVGLLNRTPQKQAAALTELNITLSCAAPYRQT